MCPTRRPGNNFASKPYDLIGAPHYPPDRDFPGAEERLCVAAEGQFHRRGLGGPPPLFPAAGGGGGLLGRPSLLSSFLFFSFPGFFGLLLSSWRGSFCPPFSLF